MSVKSRTELKDYCLRKLGYPVIEINVDDDQIDDRINDALEKFQEYHYDGTERLYLKHQITANNVSDQYIPIPNTINQIVGVWPGSVGSGSVSSSSPNYMFSVNYQIRVQDLYDFSGNLAHYAMAKQYIETLNMLLTGTPGHRWNAYHDKLYIDLEWGVDLVAGNWLIIECFGVVDPDTYTRIWNDHWLKEYTAALIKRQWGSNTKKYNNITLPGGIQMTGQQIYDEAVAEIKELELELREVHETPTPFFVG